MRRFTSVVLMAAALLLSGCYRTVVRSGMQGDGKEHRGGGLTFLYGLTPVHAGAVECPYGLARVETYVAWYSFFLAPLTGGLVSGMETQYECAARPVPMR